MPRIKPEGLEIRRATPADDDQVIPLLQAALKKDDDPATGEALRHVVNFGLSYTIYMFIAWLTSFILIGLIIGPIITIAFYVFLIIGAIQANDGKVYKPPFTLDIIK